MALSVDQKERLAKLLAMFSSDYDGEVTSAARAAERLIKGAGETWETVILNGSASSSYRRPEPPPRPQPRRPSAPSHQAEAKEYLEKEHLLTTWEIEFLNSILGRYSLTDKQRSRLDEIKAKLDGMAGMNW